MTTATALARPADRESVLQLLAAGKTVQLAADALSLPRPAVMRVIQSTKGWMHDPDRDTVYEVGRRGMAPQLPEGVSPAEQPVHTISDLISRARRLDDKAVQRALKKALDAIAQLRQAVGVTEEKLAEAREREQARKTALAEVEELEAKLAAAKTRARELGVRRSRTAAPASPAGYDRPDPDPKKVRAWCKERGIEVNEMGRVPRRVTEQYLAETAGAQ